MPTLKQQMSGMSHQQRGAMYAEVALNAFRHATNCDPEDALADLLCDLMHWCGANDVHWTENLERAEEHNDAEYEEDQE